MFLILILLLITLFISVYCHLKLKDFIDCFTAILIGLPIIELAMLGLINVKLSNSLYYLLLMNTSILFFILIYERNTIKNVNDIFAKEFFKNEYIYMYLLFIISFIFFFYQGAYLEVPSDNIGVHLYRVAMASLLDSIQGVFPSIVQQSGTGPSYYAAIALIKQNLKLSDELFFNIYSSVIITLFVISIWRLSSFFIKNKFLVLVAIFYAAGLLGIDIYSYFKYYSFAPCMAMQIVYYSFLLSLVKLLSIKQKYDLKIYMLIFIYFTFISVVAFLSHKQEFIFIIVALLLFLLTRTIFQKKVKMVSFLLVLLLFLLPLIYVFYLKVNMINISFVIDPNFIKLFNIFDVQFYTADFFGIQNIPGYNHIGKVINTSYKIAILQIVFCLFLFTIYTKSKSLKIKEKNLFLLLSIIAPFVLLMDPFTLFPLHYRMGTAVMYRFLYGTPLFIALPFLVEKFILSKVKQNIFAFINIFVFCWVALDSNYTGRLYHFFQKNDKASSPFRDINLYTFLRKLQDSNIGENYIVASDWITSYPLTMMTNMYTQLSNPLLHRCSFGQNHAILGANSLAYFLEIYNNQFFDLLIVNLKEKDNSISIAGHWDKDVRSTINHYNPWIINALIKNELSSYLKLIYKKEEVAVYVSRKSSLNHSFPAI